jgi:type 2A phosphatase activator TIP41
MSLTVKLRAMPSCWFALLRCWVRVDHVGIKAVETRFFCRYSETGYSTCF